MNKQADLRKKNLIWALAKDYKLKLGNMNNLDGFSLNDLYPLAILSYLLTIDNEAKLLPYMNYLSNLDKLGSFNQIFKLAMIKFAEDKISGKRLYIKDLEKLYFDDLFQKYSNRRKSLEEELFYAFSLRYKNEVIKSTSMVRKLVLELESLSKKTNLSDFIKSFHVILKNNFKFNQSLKNPIDIKARKFHKIDSDGLFDEDASLIGSAEFTRDLDLEGIKREEDEKKYSFGKDDLKPNNKLKAAENLFGKSILSIKELRKLEKEICYGNHKSSKLLITNGDLDDNIEANFRKELVNESLEDSKYFLKIFEGTFARAKNSMKRELKNALIIDLDPVLQKNNSGILKASDVYRNIYLNDNKVFYKKFSSQASSLSVDILIDGSASQLDRKSMIAAWAYTISSALLDLEIPCRVMTFSNLERQLSLTIFREYKDLPSKNSEILKFSPAGSNRDGLAFRLVANMISKTDYQEKILIYLTDGKPFDVRIRIDNKYKDEEKDYKDHFAQMDTAIEFRKLEDKGILPLVIFTGKEEDLEGMKKIYSSNFAYIKDINRFSSIITQYIKDVIQS